MRRAAAGLIAFGLVLFTSSLSAQETPPPPGPWKFVNTMTLNLSQSAFSSNWSGGDRGSFVWVIQSDLTGERQFSTKFNKFDAATRIDTSLDPALQIELIDAGIRKGMQYKENLTIGITYRLF